MKKETEAQRMARLGRLANLPDSALDFSDAPEATDAELSAAKTEWGGRRSGSGRKRSNHIRLTLSVSRGFRRELQRKAEKEGLTLSAYVQTHLAG